MVNVTTNRFSYVPLTDECPICFFFFFFRKGNCLTAMVCLIIIVLSIETSIDSLTSLNNELSTS